MFISLDFETHLIGNGAVFPKPICLSTYDGKNTQLLNAKDAREYLSAQLEGNSWIAHNAVFECGVIITHFPELAEKVEHFSF